MSKQLSKNIIAKVARDNGIEPAALNAVILVECSGSGFLPDGRCKILFEGHIFWRQLVIMGINPARHVIGNQDILYEVWDKSKYVGGAGEYARLEKAMKIHRIAALRSASYGMFQIMGFNHLKCGYDNIDAFVADMHDTAEKQLQAGITFIKNSNLIDYLNNKNWKEFARRYNGPGYEQNSYDIKLQQAYQKSLELNRL